MLRTESSPSSLVHWSSCSLLLSCLLLLLVGVRSVGVMTRPRQQRSTANDTQALKSSVDVVDDATQTVGKLNYRSWLARIIIILFFHNNTDSSRASNFFAIVRSLLYHAHLQCGVIFLPIPEQDDRRANRGKYK